MNKNNLNVENLVAIDHCEVCGNHDLIPAVNLGMHPLCDDLIPVGADVECAEYPIEILYCKECYTAHQKYQVSKKILFPTTYHYRSRFTADVLNGMSALVEACEQRLGSLKDKLVLDIGCNDGSLLGFFKSKGAKTVGIDPTDAVKDGMDKGHHLMQGYFDATSAQNILSKYGTPDIITFTNVFAHIENLPALLAAVKILTGDTTVIVIENHYLGAVLERFQFDTFYHEHPRTYSLTSFQQIAQSINAQLIGVEFPSRYGGNIRVFIANKNNITPDELARSAIQQALENEKSFERKILELQGVISSWQLMMKKRIAELVAKHGTLHAKAFPGRAAILIKLLDLDSSMVEAAYEKPGSMKLAHYIPGTRIVIKSDDELFVILKKLPVILNFAWHISTEIKTYLVKNGYEGEVIDIFDPEELL